MDTEQAPRVSPTTQASQVPLPKTVAMVFAVVAQIVLLDAALETFHSGSPIRWWIVPPVVFFLVLSVWLWRPRGRLAQRSGWPGAAAMSVGGVLVLLAASAWLPGGLSEGVRLGGQPTAVVLSVLTICAVVLSGGIALRTRSLSPWVRMASAGLAAYACAALLLGLMRATPYRALFHGAGFWTSLPVWLQGPPIGTCVVLPLGAAVLVVAWQSSRRASGARPVRLEPAVLLIAGFATGLAAVLAGGGGPATLQNPLAVAGGQIDVADTASAASPAVTEEQRQVINDRAAGQLQTYGTLAGELRASPIDLDEALKKIGREPAALGLWIQQHVAFEPYEGFMKGAQGALVSGRANSADKALLLAELLRRAGVSAKLVRGTLSGGRQVTAGLPEDLTRPPTSVQVDEIAKRLELDGAELRAGLSSAQVRHEKVLENLWTRVDRDVDAVGGALAAAHVSVPGAVTWPAPAEHWWVRTDKGDLDPTLGQPAGTETASYDISELPADQFHGMTIRIHIAKGGKESTVLERSFRSADLFGQSIAVGNVPMGFARKLESGGKLTAEAVLAAAGAVTEFQPQVIAGGKTQKGDTFDLRGDKVTPANSSSNPASGVAGGMGGLFGGLGGGEDQEKKPTGKLTAAYLEIELIAPGDSQPVRIRRDILLPGSNGRQRILDLLAVREILVLPDEITPDYVNNALLEYTDAWRQWISAHNPDTYNPLKISAYESQPHLDTTLYAFGLLRRSEMRHLSETRFGRTLWVHPRPMVVSYVRRLVDAKRPAVAAGIDILENTLLPLEGRASDWRHQFAFAAGILDTALEHEVNSGPGIHRNTSVYLEQALLQGRQPVAVQGALPRDVRLSAVAREDLQEQLRGAAVVLVPQDPSSWYRVDLATGTTLGYVEGGGGQELAEYAEKIAMDIELKGIMEFWGNLFKCIAMGVEAPLSGSDNPVESLEDCFKLMCSSVPGAVSKAVDAEGGLLGGAISFGVDKFYEKFCEAMWKRLTGKRGEGKGKGEGK